MCCVMLHYLPTRHNMIALKICLKLSKYYAICNRVVQHSNIVFCLNHKQNKFKFFVLSTEPNIHNIRYFFN